MPRQLNKRLREVVVVALVCVAIDQTVSGLWYRELLSMAVGELQANNIYAYVPNWRYHHDLRPNTDMARSWGGEVYHHKADEFGLRVGMDTFDRTSCSTVYVVGDSYTEGLGVDYGKTWVGLLSNELQSYGVRTLNLGVASYGPVIYHRKIDRIIDRTGVPPNEVLLFLDIGDMRDEVEKFVEIGDRVSDLAQENSIIYSLRIFLQSRSITVQLLYQLKKNLFSEPYRPDPSQYPLGYPPVRWTVDSHLFQQFGAAGLKSAERNLDRLAAMCRLPECRLTVAVYPYPDQIFEGDIDSLQVRYWRDWAERVEVNFVNLFPPFFVDSPEATFEKYFIDGDVHWNLAGHRLIFDALWQKWRPMSNC